MAFNTLVDATTMVISCITLHIKINMNYIRGTFHALYLWSSKNDYSHLVFKDTKVIKMYNSYVLLKANCVLKTTIITQVQMFAIR